MAPALANPKDCAHPTDRFEQQTCQDLAALLDKFKTSKNEYEQAAAARMLGYLQYDGAVSAMIEEFNKSWLEKTVLAGSILESLGKIKTSDAVNFLLERVRTPLQAPNPGDSAQLAATNYLNHSAGYILAQLKDSRVIAALVGIVNATARPSDDVMLAIATNSDQIKDAANLSQLLTLFKHADMTTRFRAAESVRNVFRSWQPVSLNFKEWETAKADAITALDAVSKNSSEDERIKEFVTTTKLELNLQGAKDQNVQISLHELYGLLSYVKSIKGQAEQMKEYSSPVTRGDVKALGSLSIVKSYDVEGYDRALGLDGNVSGNLEVALEDAITRAVKNSAGK